MASRRLMGIRLVLLLLVMIIPAFFFHGAVPTARAQNVSSISSVYVDPVQTDAAVNTFFTVNVRLNLTSDQTINAFDLRLNYSVSTYLNVIQAVNVSYAGNIFSTGANLVSIVCIDDVVIVNTCEGSDRIGQVHFSEAAAGWLYSGPAVGQLLFSVKFKVVGSGTAIFAIDRAILVNPGSDLNFPSPTFVQLVAEDGVFGDAGIVAFFNFRPSMPPAILPGQNAVFDARGSFNANNQSVLVTSYTWNFGDGTPAISSSSAFVLHPFSDAKKYSVSLTVVDAKSGTGQLSRIVTVLPALGGLLLTVEDIKGNPMRSNALVQIFNSSASTRSFGNQTTDIVGTASFQKLIPGTYVLKFSGVNVETTTKTETVIGGWTSRDTVYVKVDVPSPPSDYSGLIFLGSLGGAMGVVAAAIMYKRRKGQRGDSVSKPAHRKNRKNGRTDRLN